MTGGGARHHAATRLLGVVFLPQLFQLLTEPRRLGLGMGSSGDGRIQLTLQPGACVHRAGPGA